MEPVDGAPGFCSGSLTLGGCGLPSNERLADCFAAGNGRIQGGRKIRRSGRSRGGFSTKIHLKTDLDGDPLDFHLTGGEVSDTTQFETSLDLGPDITPRVAIADADRANDRKLKRLRSPWLFSLVPCCHGL
jgi:hypothetical protein